MGLYDEIIEYYHRQLDLLSENKIHSDKRKILLLEQMAIYQYFNNEVESSRKSLKEAINLYSLINNKLYSDKLDGWYKLLEESIDEDDFIDKIFTINNNMKLWDNKLIDLYIDRKNNNLQLYCDLLIEKYPDNIGLYEIVIDAMYHADAQEAIKYIRKLLKLQPDNINAINTLIDIYSHNYNKDKAIKLIDSKLYLDEYKEELLVQKIRILESMTLYDEALECYDEYLEIEKEDGYINNPLTIFDKLQCIEKKAVDYYQQEEYQNALNSLKQIPLIYNNIKEAPSKITSQHIVTDWYKLLDDTIDKNRDNPIKFFKKFYTLTDKTTPIWKEKIQSHINTKTIISPDTYCDILLRINGEDREILLLKAQYYIRYDKKTTLEIYDKILKKNPDDTEVLTNKFNILIQEKKYEKAYQLIHKIHKDYNTSSYIKELGCKFYKNAEYEKSRECLNIVVDENTTDVQIINTLKKIWIILDDKESQKKSPYYQDWIEYINYKHEEYQCPHCQGKLIPIIYGLPSHEMIEKNGKDYILGGCCVSNDMPQDYCPNCRKEINMGLYGIDIKKDNYSLYNYTYTNIINITYLLKHKNITIKDLEEELYTSGLDKIESEAFIEKLIQIKHIEKNKDKLSLTEDFEKFQKF